MWTPILTKCSECDIQLRSKTKLGNYIFFSFKNCQIIFNVPAMCIQLNTSSCSLTHLWWIHQKFTHTVAIQSLWHMKRETTNKSNHRSNNFFLLQIWSFIYLFYYNIFLMTWLIVLVLLGRNEVKRTGQDEPGMEKQNMGIRYWIQQGRRRGVVGSGTCFHVDYQYFETCMIIN